MLPKGLGLLRPLPGTNLPPEGVFLYIHLCIFIFNFHFEHIDAEGIF